MGYGSFKSYTTEMHGDFAQRYAKLLKKSTTNSANFHKLGLCLLNAFNF